MNFCVCVCVAGDAQFNEAMGYPMVQQWRVRSNLYKVKLSAITLATGMLGGHCHIHTHVHTHTHRHAHTHTDTHTHRHAHTRTHTHTHTHTDTGPFTGAV